MSTEERPSHVLLTMPAVLSLRHASSLLLLALAAGAVNAGAFVACGRFVTHVSGTLTLIGVDVWSWVLALEYTAIIVAFIAGATASVVTIQGRAMRGTRPLHAVPLFASALILIAIGAFGSAGFFGPIGGKPEEPVDFALLVSLAFSMGLMNAAVASSTAISARTTHMTGPATDIGVSLGVALYSEGKKRREALALAGVRSGKLVAFIVGAIVMIPFLATSSHAAFIAPAVVILFATFRSFMPSEVTATAVARAT